MYKIQSTVNLVFYFGPILIDLHDNTFTDNCNIDTCVPGSDNQCNYICYDDPNNELVQEDEDFNFGKLCVSNMLITYSVIDWFND